MRVYVPATVEDLLALHSSGQVRCPVAFTVTEALAAAYGPGEEDEYEHSAMCAAAAASRAQQGSQNWRRVVLTVEIPDDKQNNVVVIDATQGELTLKSEVTLPSVVAIHIDEAQRSDELTDDDAADLQWFAAQELGHLIEGDHS